MKCGPGKATLIGSKAVVFDKETARCLFTNGFFGNPVGLRKPKTTEIDRPIELSLYETLYLAEKGVLEVVKGGSILSIKELINYIEEQVPSILSLYHTYRELRDTGFIVRSALKYGVDFAVYRKRPGLEHAPYLVKVVKYDELMDPGDLIGWGRVSHSVKKELLLAITYPSKRRIYITFKWLRP